MTPGSTPDGGADDADGATVRVWLVERTYSDDEQNLIILVYATPDGERYLRKERAITSFTGDRRDTEAALDVDPERLAAVDDVATRERYEREAGRMMERHGPDDAV